jgi:dolichol kinase
MTVTLSLEGQRIADELSALLEAVDEAMAAGAPQAAALRLRATAVGEQMREALRAEVEPRAASLRDALREALDALERATPAESGESAWARFGEQVRPAQEALTAALARMTAAARPPRPMNRARMVMHVAMGTSATALTVLLPSRAWLVGLPLAVAVWAWTTEFLRVRSARVNEWMMRLFGPVAHAHERTRVNSSTWFVTGLVIIAAAFPRTACTAAVMSLAVGDTAASLVGRRFGRTRLRNGRSLEGTAAFAVVAGLASMLALRAGYPMSWAQAALMGAVAGVSGALTELSSERLDDNFSIPVTVAAVLTAVLMAQGLA